MKRFRYLPDTATLELDTSKCTGCRMCETVCPHRVLEVGADRLARIADLDACMECGACVTNCASGALSVAAGTGCAAAIISGWLGRGDTECCG